MKLNWMVEQGDADEKASRFVGCVSFLVWVSLGDSVDLRGVRGDLMFGR